MKKNNRRIVFGLMIAGGAQIASVGLLATAGWFIVASAIAGLSIYNVFIYLYPSALVRLFAVSRIALNYLQRLLTHKYSMDLLTEVRLKFFNRVVDKWQKQITTSGVLVDRLMNDAEQVSMSAIRVQVPIFAGIITILAASLAMLTLSYNLTLLMIMSGIISIVGYFVVKKESIKQLATNKMTQGQVRDLLITSQYSWQELMSLGATEKIRDVLTEDLSRYSKSNIKTLYKKESCIQLVNLAQIILGCYMLFIAVSNIHLNAENTVLLYLLIAGVTSVMALVPVAAADAAEVSFANQRLMLNDAEDNSENRENGIELSMTKSGLVIQRYLVPESAIARGQVIAGKYDYSDIVLIKGASGVGKTTLLTTLSRFIPNDAYRYVTVDDYIFTGTVRDNFLIDSDVVLNDSALEQILRDLMLDYLSLDDLIGEGGRELSGGEQTRLVLARALLAKQRILLLDEPLAGLDNNIAKQVIKTIDNRTKGKLVFIVTHETVEDTIIDRNIKQITFLDK